MHPRAPPTKMRCFESQPLPRAFFQTLLKRCMQCAKAMGAKDIA